MTRYVRNPKQPLRNAVEYESAFNRLVKPRIGKLGIYEVRRSHIIKMLDEIEDERSGPADGVSLSSQGIQLVRDPR